jgi:hypothetical protein
MLARIENDGDVIYGREWTTFGQRQNDCSRITSLTYLLQLCDTLLAEESESVKAGGDTREDGHEGERS